MAFRSAAGYAAGLEFKESLPVSGRWAFVIPAFEDRDGRSRCMITGVGDQCPINYNAFCKTFLCYTRM